MRETNLKLLREREGSCREREREREGRIACELWLGRETRRAQREIVCESESERFPNSTVWVFEIHGFKLIKF